MIDHPATGSPRSPQPDGDPPIDAMDMVHPCALDEGQPPEPLSRLAIDLLDAAWHSYPERIGQEAATRQAQRHGDQNDVAHGRGVHVRPYAPPLEWASTPEGKAARQLRGRGLGTIHARHFIINDAGRAERMRLHAAGEILEPVYVDLSGGQP